MIVLFTFSARKSEFLPFLTEFFYPYAVLRRTTHLEIHLRKFYYN